MGIVTLNVPAPAPASILGSTKLYCGPVPSGAPCSNKSLVLPGIVLFPALIILYRRRPRQDARTRMVA